MPLKGSIEELKSIIVKRNGLAKPTRFVLEISLPGAIGSSIDMSDLSIMCQSASLPTRQISTVDYTSFRQSFKIPAGYTTQDVICTFLLSADFFPKNVFDKWLELIVDPVTYRVNYVADYSANINIYQLDDYLNKIYGVQLRQAFPTTVSPIDVSADSTDSIQKLSVTFSYYDVLYLTGAGEPKVGPDDGKDSEDNQIPEPSIES